MNANNPQDRITEYLNVYANAPRNKHPVPSPSLVKFFRKHPEESFLAIANNSFQAPQNLDFRDLDDPLCRLLLTFVDLIPNLVVPQMTKGFWASRFLYISSAAASKSTVFIPTIIDLMTDRSIYIKTLVLQLIIQYPHLHVSKTIPNFEKLSKQKSFKESEMDRKLLEKAIQSVSSTLKAKRQPHAHHLHPRPHT